jgi:hypothetical protein
MRHTHSDRLERWLGAENVDRVSTAMREWYGPPIALSGVPGNVRAVRGGDFIGRIRAGSEASALDRGREILHRLARGYRSTVRRRATLSAGFSSLSDLIAEATAGKRIEFAFQKVGTTGVVASTNSLWRVGASPAAGAQASVAPTGDSPTDATTGAMPFTNPASGNTLHFVLGCPLSSVAGNNLLLYDRIFQVRKTMNSSATEAVTGVPTRYQSTTPTDPDFAGGNFVFPECGTALPATAHNWTVCQYTDQDGNTTQSIPSIAGNSSNIINRLDLPAGYWFMPLAASDYGIKALTQMQCSANVATGAIDFVIGHPIAWMPCPIANLVCIVDGINSAFNLVRIFDDAALALLEVNKPATTATTYNGTFLTCYG